MDKFQNKYRIPSARLRTWDYGSNAAYFLTICTADREHFFGEIVNEPVVKNDSNDNVETQCIASLQPTVIGKLVESEWIKTPTLRPDMNLELGEFVIMPNHFHAILIIGDNNYNHSDQSNKNQFGPQRKNVASVIRGFKSAVTKNAHIINRAFEWQERFYDHIIRDEPEYQRIVNYITNNPSNWKDDKFCNPDLNMGYNEK